MRAAALASLAPLDAALAQAARKGFDTQGLQVTLQALGLAAPVPSLDLVLEAPDIAESGEQVPISLQCKLPGVKKMWLLAERNATALLASLEFSEAMEPQLGTRIRLARSSLVYGVAQLQDGKLLLAQHDVKVALSTCTGKCR